MFGKHLETADECVLSVWDDIAPRTAIGDLRLGYLDDAEVAGLPVGSNDEPIAAILELVLVIAFSG
jgi:hypothetical protein